MRICHNFVKPPMAFGGKTLARAAGNQGKRENGWLIIMENASRNS
jgi:hypothetical protein